MYELNKNLNYFLIVVLTILFGLLLTLIVTSSAKAASDPMIGLIELHNEAREKIGARKLTDDQVLRAGACDRALYLANNWKFSHDGWFNTFPKGYDNSGENLAVYKTDSSFNIFEAWMNSEHHKYNILKPEYNRIGICTVVRGELSFVVVWFGSK